MNENNAASSLNELWDSLSEEQKEQAFKAKSLDELFKIAGKAGCAIPDDLLDTVSGGFLLFDESKNVWRIVNDITGEIFLNEGEWNNPLDALNRAWELNQSGKQISYAELVRIQEEYKKRGNNPGQSTDRNGFEAM